MQYLKTGLNKTFSIIKKKKKLFAILVIIQLVLLISIATIGINYQIKIFTHLQNVVQPLENANYDPDSIQAGDPFLDDLFAVQKSYQLLKKNLVELLLWITLIYLVLQGSAWILTHYLFHKINLYKSGKILIKFALSSLFILSIFLAVCYFILKSLIGQPVDVHFFSEITRYLLITFGVFYYFLAIFYSMGKRNWKSNIKSVYILGIKKIHLILPIIIINSLFLLLALYVIDVSSAQQNFLVMVLGVIFLGVILVLMRIFLVASLEELWKKVNHE
jgi:hypothetical protein